ncbi:hypothetical protein K439DRAFT_1622163 [Ramaria rubella]|nr:hypothetical protein K439DRAFT_1622163 [Ramaria rubella]
MNAPLEPLCCLTPGQMVQGKGNGHRIVRDPAVKQGRGLGRWIGHEAPGQKKRGDKREAEKGRGLGRWIGHEAPGQKKRGDKREAEKGRGPENWIGYAAPCQKKRGDEREAEKGRGLENWIGYVAPGQKKRGDKREAERERNDRIENESTNKTGKPKLRMKADGSLGNHRDGIEGLQPCAVS